MRAEALRPVKVEYKGNDSPSFEVSRYQLYSRLTAGFIYIDIQIKSIAPYNPSPNIILSFHHSFGGEKLALSQKVL